MPGALQRPRHTDASGDAASHAFLIRRSPVVLDVSIGALESDSIDHGSSLYGSLYEIGGLEQGSWGARERGCAGEKPVRFTLLP